MSVQTIKQGQENLLEPGDLIFQCRTLLRNYSRVSLRFVKKQGNKIAHKSARILCELNNFIISVSSILHGDNLVGKFAGLMEILSSKRKKERDTSYLLLDKKK